MNNIMQKNSKVIVHDDEVSFNLFEATYHSKEMGVCFRVDFIDESILDVQKSLIFILL